MSDSNDVADFVKATEGYKPPPVSNSSRMADVLAAFGGDKEEPTPGQPSQYRLHGEGYTATTATIPNLPNGCYNIVVDQVCVYATPMPKPTGLLLELPEMRSNEVIDLVENFWNSEKDYKEGNEFVVGGAAFKAGVMLYGPPGTGKSCTIKIVANKLVERGGTVFFASGNPAHVMGFLEDFTQVEKNRKCIVILEDIDSLIYNFGESLYLELLDSAKTIDNVLFIATTNYPDRLDPRIYNRPGRFSHVVKIGLPSPAARRAYLEAILKNHRDVDYIVSNTQSFSIDHLSSLCNGVYREKKNLADEIKRLRTLFKVPKAEEDRSMGIGGDIE